MEKLDYNFLLKYYLDDQVNGKMETINKFYFPKDYERMKKELSILKNEQSSFSTYLS